MAGAQGPTCSICHDTGWKPVESSASGVRGVVRCDCWRENVGKRHLADANIPKRYQHCTLDNFAAYNESLEKAVASAKRMAQRSEWEAVVVRYRKVVARYPRSGYCDNALLAAGSLYREMAERFQARQYRDDALTAYRTLVMEYPSSSLGDDALWFAVEVARKGSDRRKVVETARAYLATYPAGERAAKAKALLR